MPKGELTETDNSIRITVTDKEYPDYRMIRLTSGIKLLVGLEGGKSHPATLIFDKKRFSVDKAKKWYTKHDGRFSEAVDLEEKKASLFQMDDEYLDTEHLVGHIPALSEEQISVLLKIINEELLEEVNEELRNKGINEE